jgi:hypothetical protein
MNTNKVKQPKARGKPESTSDFKARIALLKRNQETGRKYSLVGASRASECELRRKRST